MRSHPTGSVTCLVCGLLLPPPAGRGRVRRYCDRACQQAAYRARQAGPPDPAARLDDLASAVTACQNALHDNDTTALAAAAQLAVSTARALAHATGPSITPPPVTTPPPITPPDPRPSPAPTTPPARREATQTPPPATTTAATGTRTPTTTPVTASTANPADGQGPHHPPRPAADLGEGYHLQPPDPHSTRWQLSHHDRQIGYIQRATTTGRSIRWRAYTPAGIPITAASTAGRDGTYRTKRDALIQVAAQHQITNGRPRRPRPPR